MMPRLLALSDTIYYDIIYLALLQRDAGDRKGGEQENLATYIEFGVLKPNTSLDKIL